MTSWVVPTVPRVPRWLPAKHQPGLGLLSLQNETALNHILLIQHYHWYFLVSPNALLHSPLRFDFAASRKESKQVLLKHSNHI